MAQQASAQQNHAAAPSCWPGSLPPSPTKAAGRPKRETSSPCSTTAPPNLVPPWLGQTISFTTWFQGSRQEQEGDLHAPAQQFPLPGASPDPARTLFADARGGSGRPERRPGRPRRQPLERAHTAPSDAAAAWPDASRGASDPGAHRGKPRAARQGLRGGRGEAAAEASQGGTEGEAMAGVTLTRQVSHCAPQHQEKSTHASDKIWGLITLYFLVYTLLADYPACSSTAGAIVKAGELHQKIKQSLCWSFLLGSGADRKSAAAPPSKAAKGSARISAGAGGGAQKRQPGAAASSVFRGVSRHRCTSQHLCSMGCQHMHLLR